MLFAALSAAVAASCIAASARRLAWAVAPTPLDPALLAGAVARSAAAPADAAAKLCAAVGDDPALAWERALFAACAESVPETRDALLGEQITDFEARADRWARSPRVCASVSTSAGFFFATIAVLQGLSGDAGESDMEHAVLFRALDALAIGIAGMAFCAAVHLRARRAAAARWAGVDALVAKLRLAASSGPVEPSAPKTEPSASER
jgi:hypothetical protein